MICRGFVSNRCIYTCFVERPGRVVDRYVVFGDILVKICQYLCGFLGLSLCGKVHCQLHEYTSVCMAHAHNRFINVNTFFVYSAELELVHHHVITALCVEVFRSCCISRERSDAVYKTFLYEVVSEVHVVILTYGESYVYRAYPIALGYHFKHHEVTFV